MWRIDLVTMTKHLTKPIRAIHFLVLAFLMTLSSPVAARDYNKGVATAEAGDAEAQFNLGARYEFGMGVPQNETKAAKWYRLAAEQGVKYAHTYLGVMYANGQGVRQDNAVAHMWFNIGAANGHELGGTNRDKMATEMTSEAIEKAQAMARECMNSGYTKWVLALTNDQTLHHPTAPTQHHLWPL